MFDDVLVGVDGREGGRDALALTHRLAHPGGLVTVAHVYVLPASRRHTAALSLCREQAAMRPPPGPYVGLLEAAAIRDSSVGRGLHRLLAERSDADLLVVGSSHRGPLGRTFLGDDTRAALDGAPCAVAIAPRGYAAADPRSTRLSRIGVGCHAPSQSARAITVARALAARHRAEIRALSVVSLQSIPEGEPVPARWPKIAGQLVADELRRLGQLDGVAGDAVYGDPGEELAAFTREVDLLILRARDDGVGERALNGSISSRLVRRARCPLVILPSHARSSGHSTRMPAADAEPTAV
jgi:nucleotide-binding universal stress UspA family protein